MRSLQLLGFATFACMFLLGCQNQLSDENMRLYRENQNLRSQLADVSNRPAVPATDPNQIKSLQDQIAERDAEIARLKNQPAPQPPQPGGFEGMDTTFDPKAGTLTVALPGDVLFDSGQSELKASAKATLDKVAAALNKDYAGKAIRVEGHTDNDPIVKTKDKYASNLHLSLERARAVTDYLVATGKVDPKRILTGGHGEFAPRGAEKSRNRRVEIVVVMR